MQRVPSPPGSRVTRVTVRFITTNAKPVYMKRIRAPGVILIVLLACVIISGCIGEGGDRVVGTWEWSDGKGYTETYTFGEDHSFRAEALGSTFSGTWEESEPGQYRVTYCNDAEPDCMEPLTETMIYDESTDAVYFPAHQRVG